MPLPLLLVPLLTAGASYLARDVLLEGAGALAESALGGVADWLSEQGEDEDEEEEEDDDEYRSG